MDPRRVFPRACRKDRTMRLPLAVPLESGCRAAVLGMVLLVGTAAGPAPSGQSAGGEWPNYGGDQASTKYAPLAQIDRDNFKRLKVAWTWRSPDEEVIRANPRL